MVEDFAFESCGNSTELVEPCVLIISVVSDSGVKSVIRGVVVWMMELYGKFAVSNPVS